MGLGLCLLLLTPLTAAQEDGAASGPLPFELKSLECGELDQAAGLLPLRPSHAPGDDRDLLCKVTVVLPRGGGQGTPRAHAVTLSVLQPGKKAAYQETRDAHLLAPGARTVLFVVPAERLPGEGGKVVIRAEVSRPVQRPGFREIIYDLTAED